MKFKNILGVGLVIASMVASSCNVFADNQRAFTFGTPIDSATGKAVDGDIVKGSVIAVPVDVTPAGAKSVGYVVSLSYDENYLEVGATHSDLTATQKSNLKKMSGSSSDITVGSGVFQKFKDTDTTCLIKNVYTIEDDEKVFLGTYTPVANAAGESNRFNFSWVAGAIGGYAFSDTEPEAFVVFTVKDTISADKLNYSLFELNGVGSDTYVDKINTETMVSVNKVNPTQGAFKVVLDADALPAGNWVQGLYAQVGDTRQDITACVHEDGTKTYEFPVRVNSATGATDYIDVDIYADTTADEAGETDVTAKKIGSINLSMDSTVTSYETVDGAVAE